jgi:ATP-dependent helicase/nuclease subunit A
VTVVVWVQDTAPFSAPVGESSGGPVDSVARYQVENRLHDSLFVEAGAGSGKTSALVARIVRLICSGTCTLDELTAITFTEEAAAELRTRVRKGLEAVARGGGESPEASLAAAALDEIDEAQISTIHAFCRRLLAEHPVEAGLPPRFDVLDEVGQSLAWRSQWSAALDRFCEDDGTRALFSLASALGLTPRHLSDLAAAAGRDWHRCGADLPDVARIIAAIGLACDSASRAMLTSIREASLLAGHCSAESDYLLRRVRQLQQFATELGEASGAEERLALTAKAPRKMRHKLGRRDNWDCDVELVRICVASAAEARDSLLSRTFDLVLPGLVATFDVLARDNATDRCRRGQLLFHDLLVLARDLLRDQPDVLGQVQRRVKHLLVDEFQDTDPLQLEIVTLIGAEEPEAETGRLFFVGDPKQSIYRFRGADLDAYEAARQGFPSRAVVGLTSNFRSVPDILDFANACFESLMPGYSALHPERTNPSQAASVRLVGGPLDAALRRNEQRSGESQAVASMIERAVRTERWLVDDGGSWRPARLSDVAILVPRRTGLSQIESALDELKIGYRVESASLIYRSQEVRDLLALCRAVDDPGDQVALLAVLRSSSFACGDDDLLAYRRSGGHWSIEETPAIADPGAGQEASPAPSAVAGAGDPAVVIDSLKTLRGYRALRFELGPIGLLEHAIADRRLLQMAAGSPRERESWRRMRFLVERARTFAEAGGGGLGDFAEWVDEQLAEGLRAVESVLPEPDEDVVHILTVHGAKGLEFPIAVLAGFGTTDEGRASGVSVLRGADGVEVRLRADLETSGHRNLKSFDDLREREEAIRLLYVAVTRARDHLVVCAHHVPPKDSTRADDEPQLPADIHGLAPAFPGFIDRSSLGQRLYEVAMAALATHPGLYEVVDFSGAVSTTDETSEPTPVPAPLQRRGGRRGPGPGQEALFDVEPLSASTAAGPATLVEPAPAKAVAAFRAPIDAIAAPKQVPRAMASADDYKAWVVRRRLLLERLARPALVHATDLVDVVFGSDVPTSADGGRTDGTHLGRAVHITLQRVPLATARRLASGRGEAGDESLLADLATAAARAEGIADRAGEVGRLSNAALTSPTVAAALQSPSPRREVYVATTVGDVVLDGYIDLCAQATDGLVIVDYKTDAVAGEESLRAAADKYSWQAAAYALALGDATGRSVKRCVLVFVAAPDGAVEVEIADLAGLMEQVRLLVGDS